MFLIGGLEMSNFFKSCMFITSFIPLWVSIIFLVAADFLETEFLYSSTEIIKRMVIIAIIITINFCAALYIRSAIKSVRSNSSYHERVTIVKAHKEKSITSEYLLSYILPLFAFDYSQWKEIVLFLIYFTTLAFLCIRNGNVYTNLLFEVKGFSFYSCEVRRASGSEQQITILAKADLLSRINHTIEVADLNKPFYIMIGS